MAIFLVTVDYDEDGDNELALEIFLEYDGPNPERLTKEEVEAVFREIVTTGEIPAGWDVQMVEWNHGEKTPDHEGTVVELSDFDAVVRNSELGVEMQLRFLGELDLDVDMTGDNGE